MKSTEEASLTRRDFLRGTATAALAAAFGLPGTAGAARPGGKRAKVVLVRHEQAVNADGGVNERVIQGMLDQAVAALSGTKNTADAWRRLVKPTDLVGIKTNVWARLPTPPELTEALRRRIVQAGVPEAAIRIDDRGARHTLADCTALVNARPVRTHDWAGIGGCMKNYMPFVEEPPRYHPDTCADLAAIWSLPIVKGKTRLNVLVALTPLFWGRGPHHFDPRYVWPYKGILVSFDPVAIDAVGAHLLRTKRLQHFGEDKPIKPTTHIALAETRHGLGVADLRRIDLVKLGWAEDVLI